MVRFRGYKEDPDVAVFDLRWLRRLWPFVRPYRGALYACFLILIAGFGVDLLKPYLMRLAIDGPIKDAIAGRRADHGTLWRLGSVYFAALLVNAGLGYAFGLLAARNGQRVIRDVRKRLHAHLLSLSPRFFDKNPAGKLVTRVTNDVENLNELISTGVLHALFDAFKIVGLMIALFVLNPGLALFTLGCAPVIFVCSMMFRGMFRRSYRAVRGRLARQNAFTAEAIGGLRVTRVFGQEQAVQSHYEELNGDTRASWLRTIGAFALFTSVVDLAIHGSTAGMLWFGGNDVIAGTLSFGALFQFWTYFSTLAGPIKEIGEKYNVLQSAFASSERIFGILDEPEFPPPAADALPSIRGPASIRFEHVSFRYVPEKPVLQDVSFDVRPGQRVALVGPTGAGKSTVLALLSRLMDPDSGKVLLDGRDLRDLEIESVRRRIAVVPQDVFLFTGTVLDNVRLFDETIPETRAAAALEAVGAWEFVQRLEGGLHAKVEERGATFSQGERQLLSFARALAADPDVLVLDEATASIDSETEARIQKALQTVLRGRTSVVVAHRLSTVRDADRILVLQKGRLVESGSHKELLAHDGVYARMVRQVASV